MDFISSKTIALAFGVGGLLYLIKTLDFGFRTQDRFYEYVFNPLERRRTERSTFDLTIPDRTIEEAAYEAYLEDAFIDATTRVGWTADEGVIFRGRGDWNRMDVTIV